jgi:3-deoxy-D-manno-octulosonate 8-phosphate phosphatase (KDO 8-P phosphatase)
MIDNISQDVMTRFKKIKLLVLDVDGVLTDGGLMIGDDGQEYKTFHAHDGLGMKLLKSTGVEIAIITGRTSNVVQKRAESIGITHLYQGAHDKLEAWQDLIQKMNIAPHESAFMGDDVIDLPPMINGGLAIAVPDSPQFVLDRAHYITHKAGGRGAVREVCEVMMQAQGSFDATMATFLTQAKISN